MCCGGARRAIHVVHDGDTLSRTRSYNRLTTISALLWLGCSCDTRWEPHFQFLKRVKGGPACLHCAAKPVPGRPVNSAPENCKTRNISINYKITRSHHPHLCAANAASLISNSISHDIRYAPLRFLLAQSIENIFSNLRRI